MKAKVQNMCDAAIGIAYESNEARDRMFEHRAAKESLTASEQSNREVRARTLARFGLTETPEDYNHCDSPDLYMHAVFELTEADRFEKLATHAAKLFNSVEIIEANSNAEELVA